MIAPVQSYRSNGQHPTRVQAWEVAEAHLSQTESANDTSIGSRVTQTVGRHPIAAIATAAAVGIVAGWLVKRKL